MIKPKFYHGGAFNEGVADVALEPDGKFGFININGDLIIDLAYPFSEGLAPVQINDKWGYINKKNIIVIEPRFDFAFNFKNCFGYMRIKAHSIHYVP